MKLQYVDLHAKAQAACSYFIQKMYRPGPDVSTGFCGLHHVRHHKPTIQACEQLNAPNQTRTSPAARSRASIGRESASANTNPPPRTYASLKNGDQRTARCSTPFKQSCASAQEGTASSWRSATNGSAPSLTSLNVFRRWNCHGWTMSPDVD